MSLNDDDWLQSSSGSGAFTPWPEEYSENIEGDFTPVRLAKVVSLDLILGIQAALPTKGFIGQDAKCL